MQAHTCARACACVRSTCMMTRQTNSTGMLRTKILHIQLTPTMQFLIVHNYRFLYNSQTMAKLLNLYRRMRMYVLLDVWSDMWLLHACVRGAVQCRQMSETRIYNRTASQITNG